LPSQADSGKILLPFFGGSEDSKRPSAVSDLLRLCDSMFFVSSDSFRPFLSRRVNKFFATQLDKNRIGNSFDQNRTALQNIV
jgi:hypothetical protein